MTILSRCERKLPAVNIGFPNRDIAPDKAMTAKEDNDTPVQSQSEREKTVAGNEGGSVRTTVGVELPWCQFAADHLATSHSISGCRGQIEMLLS